MAGVTLPIYRGRIDSAVGEASARAVRSQQTYEAERDNVLRDVVSLHSRALEHQQVLEILQSEIVPKAITTIELAIESYRTNRIDYERVIDAYRDLLRHQIRELEQQASREKTISMLERRLGCVAATWQDGSFEEVSMVGRVAPEPPE